MTEPADHYIACRCRSGAAGAVGVLAVLGLAVGAWVVFAWAVETARASARPRLVLRPVVVSEPGDDMEEFTFCLGVDGTEPGPVLPDGAAGAVVTIYDRTDTVPGDTGRQGSLPILLSWLGRRELKGGSACDELRAGYVLHAGFKRKAERGSVVVVVDLGDDGSGTTRWTSAVTGY